MNESAAPLLSVKNLIKYYKIEDQNGKKEVLKNISIDIYKNEFVCILGPSGCGKSTLLRCIGGFEKYEGTIFLNEKKINEPDTDRIMVFQEFNQLFPWKTVLDNVQYPLLIQNKQNKKIIRESAMELLGKVGLSDYYKYYPHQLSGGMKQRVAIIRALALKPTVILMDEPFASLDAITRNNLQQELIQIATNEKINVIFVTHNIQEAITLGTRVIVLSKEGVITVNEINTIPKPVRPSTSGYADIWERLNSAIRS